jgi:hypothetical protein
VLLRLHEP